MCTETDQWKEDDRSGSCRERCSVGVAWSRVERCERGRRANARARARGAARCRDEDDACEARVDATALLHVDDGVILSQPSGWRHQEARVASAPRVDDCYVISQQSEG